MSCVGVCERRLELHFLLCALLRFAFDIWLGRRRGKKLYFESFRWIKGWITWCILDDDGTRGFGGGGGCWTHKALYYGGKSSMRCWFNLLGGSSENRIFSKPGKNLMCFTYSQRAHHERKSHAWCSHSLCAHSPVYMESEFGNSSSSKRVKKTSPDRAAWFETSGQEIFISIAKSTKVRSKATMRLEVRDEWSLFAVLKNLKHFEIQEIKAMKTLVFHTWSISGKFLK